MVTHYAGRVSSELDPEGSAVDEVILDLGEGGQGVFEKLDDLSRAKPPESLGQIPTY